MLTGISSFGGSSQRGGGPGDPTADGRANTSKKPTPTDPTVMSWGHPRRSVSWGRLRRLGVRESQVGPCATGALPADADDGLAAGWAGVDVVDDRDAVLVPIGLIEDDVGDAVWRETDVGRRAAGDPEVGLGDRLELWQVLPMRPPRLSTLRQVRRPMLPR